MSFTETQMKYRATSNQPYARTFICSRCNTAHTTTGRKKVAISSVSKKIAWICAVCASYMK